MPPIRAEEGAQALTSLHSSRGESFWGSGAPRRWGMIMPPREYPGDTPLGEFFGDFLIGEKVTRGMGRSAHTKVQGAAPRRH